MMRTDIDFLNEADKIIHQPKKKLKLISKIIIYSLIIFVIIFIFFGVEMITSGENLAKTLGNVGLWGQIQHLIGSNDKNLNGEKEDRINVLLLGIGGENHDGPYLTDTSILASFKPSTKQVSLVSIPRDLLVPIPGYGWQKINHADAYGEVKNPGRGGEKTAEIVSQVFGVPIHYYVRIDFAGFKQIVDDLGGITVDVENLLDDPNYPIKGKETATTTERYEHLYIKPGVKNMDGELALKFVRSREGRGIEGSDFARSKRQQKVLMAIKEKALSFGVLANPYKVGKLMDTLSQHLATNMQVWEIIKFFNLGRDITEQNITRRVLDDSPNGSLYAAMTEGGAFVLRPKAGDFSELKLIAQEVFSTGTTTAEIKPTVKPKMIEVQNGTKIVGLAGRTAQALENLGYHISQARNAPTQDYQTTVIYKLNNQESDSAVDKIAKLLGAEVASALPDWTTSTTTRFVNKESDILIILGQDHKDL